MLCTLPIVDSFIEKTLKLRLLNFCSDSVNSSDALRSTSPLERDIQSISLASPKAEMVPSNDDQNIDDEFEDDLQFEAEKVKIFHRF